MKTLLVLLFALAASVTSTHTGRNRVALMWVDDHERLIKTNLGSFTPLGVARSMAVVDTCIFDALAPFTSDWVPTINTGIPRRPRSQHTQENKEKAISFAAYRALRFMFGAFPATLNQTDALFASLGYNKNDLTEDNHSPSGIANKACKAVLALRAKDGANQFADELGTKIGGAPYSDYTNYQAVNKPQAVPGITDCVNEIANINHWQPLRVPRPNNQPSAVQFFFTPFAARIQPFALDSAEEFWPPGPALFGTNTQQSWISNFTQVLNASAALTDRTKVIAEFWADGPGSTLPPGHWQQITADLAESRGLNLQKTVQLLFVQANAVFDAGIAVWAVKRYYDSVRPITAIQCYFAGQMVKAWKGPYQGVGMINASRWQPYQAPNFITPPFSEYVSGHSAFSASSAEVLKRFFGSDNFGGSFTVKAGQSLFEPKITSGPGFIAGVTDVPNSGPSTVGYTPATDITLSWATFTQAADEAGVSRIYGGIHPSMGDLDGRRLGRQVGAKVWEKYSRLTRGNYEDHDGHDDDD